MPTYSVTNSIEAPAATVWAFLCDVLAWQGWLHTVTSITPLGVSRLEVGARFRVLQPRLRPATWEVTSVHEGESFIWRSQSSGFAMRACHVVESTGPARCKLTLTFTFYGLLSPLVGLLAGAITRRYVASEADSLKAVAETACAPHKRRALLERRTKL